MSRLSVVAVAATSSASFTQIIRMLAGGATEGSQARSVLVIGIMRLNTLVSLFAPSTGMIRLDQIRAEAIRLVELAAHTAVASLPTDIAARHWVCAGWRDAGLRRGLGRYDCERLYVLAADMPAWHRRSIRSSLAEVGVSLVVLDPAAVRRAA